MADGLDTSVTGDSVNVAEGFQPVIRAIQGLTQEVAKQTMALKAAQAMRANYGTSGSNPYSELAGGASALAGVTTEATLRERAASRTPLRKAPTDGGHWLDTPVDVPSAPQGAPANPNAGQTTTAPGGGLRKAGQAGLNFLVNGGSKSGGGWSMPAGGGPPVYTPPKGGPPMAGGSGGGTGGSSGLYGGMMSSLQKVPVVGQALGLVDEIQSQRQKNAYYQSVEGGDNVHGFGERWNEALGSFTTMGMFAPGEYSALYKDVTKMGYTDRSDNQFQSRKGAIDFAYGNKRDMGMDASESTQYLTTASRSATASFGELSTILEQVSASASKAGVNTNLARQQFDALWQANLSSGLTGSAAMQTAGATTSFSAGMGRQFSNTNFAGATSTGMNYMVAATNGQTYNQFMATANKNPAAAAAMREKTQGMGLNGVINEQVKSWIRSQVASVGGASAIEADKTLADTFWPDFLAAFPALDWNAVKSILQTFSGAQFGSDTDAFEYLVQWVMGKDANQVLIQQSKDAQIKSGSTKVTDDQFGQSGLFGSGGTSDAANAYKNWSKNNNKSDPVIESMLQGFNSGGYSQQDQKVEVVTSSGPRVVSLADAVKDFSDQLASGQAKFKGGALDGKNAGTFGTLDQSASRTASAKAEAANTSNANVGQSLQDYLKANPASGGSGSGSATSVTIGLTPQAAQIFNVQTATDAGVAPGAQGDQTFASRMAGVH